MRIIGLVAPKQSGKDTFFDTIKETGETVYKISFASKLRFICSRVFNMPMDWFVNNEYKDKTFDFSVGVTKEHLDALVEDVNSQLPIGEFDKEKLYSFEGFKFTSPRHLLQIVGSDIIRNIFDSNWHVKAALTDLEDATYIVTDIRFMNEYEALAEHKDAFEGYYIKRPSSEITVESSSHISEKEILDIRDNKHPTIINNNSTLEEYKSNILEVFNARKN